MPLPPEEGVRPIDEVVVFAVASDGSTGQWDGHATPPGVLLRWFHPEAAGFPDLGYDVHYATLPDVAELPISDGSLLRGQPEWDHVGEVVVRDPAGLTFHGVDALCAVPGTPLSLDFPDPAWSIYVATDGGIGAGADVEVWAGGAVRETVRLAPGDDRSWVTRGIDRLVFTGDLGIVTVRYRLLHAAHHWSFRTHLCLPVHDPGYPCAPPPGIHTEEEDAIRRLPPKVQGEWGKRFAPDWPELLAVLRRMALRQPPHALPPGPTGPSLGTDEAALLRLAVLDPHLARIVGLAYDDAPGVGRGAQLTYRVTGRWLGDRVEFTVGRTQTPARNGVTVTVDPPQRRSSSTSVVLGTGAVATLEWAGEVTALGIDVDASTLMRWVAYDMAGTQVADGEVDRRSRIEVAAPVHRVEVHGNGTLRLLTFAWTAVVERLGLAPGVVFTDPGPPAGPAWITANVPPGGNAATLDWDVARTTGGSALDGGAVFFQVAAADTGGDPDKPAPPAPAFADAALLREGGLVLVPRAVAAQPTPRVLLTDREGTLGWRAWWARGVDLFGRVSEPTPPVLARIADDAAPPPPRIVAAEYVQHALDDLLGRSVLARRWLDAAPSTDGVVVAFAWTPELDALCSDVDGFRLVLRRPAALGVVSPTDPATSYAGVAWPAPYASLGPVAVRHAGSVMNAATGVAVRVTDVDALDATRAYCATDLVLDTGGDALRGATFPTPGGIATVASAGEGDGVGLGVTFEAGKEPDRGAVRLKSDAVLTVETDVTVTAAPGTRLMSGLLLVGKARRLVVLGVNGGTFVCASDGEPPPSRGEPVVWYPVFAVSVADTGFGPVASLTTPVAGAQVAVRSVRRSAIESVESIPAAITAVDLTPPVTPELPVIPSGPYCAEAATRADWHGRSFFTVEWGALPDHVFTVYRALGDGINRLDRARTAGIPRSAWPAGVDVALVTADLAALETARATKDPATIDAAYAALHADAQRVIAAQPHVWPAYVALTGAPVSGASYTDTLDGRSRAHWFYRVTSRTPAGLESAPSLPTPPICCPDVVPPSPPQVRSVLAAAGGVRLDGVAVPDRDAVKVHVHRWRDESIGSDVRRRAPEHTFAYAGPSATVDVPAAAGEWCLWVTAEDGAGNVSAPSPMLRGTSLQAPPAKPVWQTAKRDGAAVTLSWTHPSDQRLACLVERRPSGIGLWTSASGWLPRGVYAFDDVPPDLDAAWDYRLRVRDTLGQTAAELPTVALAEA